ncbi:MAG TPA: amidohydrolase family protein [Mycobacteriales bacterium]
MTIDAHHHFWRYGRQHQAWRSHEHEVIARDFMPDDLSADLAAAGIDGSILVQSVDTEEENARLLDFAAQAPFVEGVVAWVPLRDPAAARTVLPGLDGHQVVRGVRCLVGRGRTDWLTRPDTTSLFREIAARGLCWDVVPVTPEQVRDVVAVARSVPELRIVVDHLARPPVDTGSWQPWADGVQALGAAPNVALKVSVGIDVLTAWATWSNAQLVPYLRWAATCFGPDRLLLASNWPVVLLRRGYADAWRDLTAGLLDAGLDRADIESVAGGNAIRWYGLAVRDRSVGAGRRGRMRRPSHC